VLHLSERKAVHGIHPVPPPRDLSCLLQGAFSQTQINVPDLSGDGRKRHLGSWELTGWNDSEQPHACAAAGFWNANPWSNPWSL
jgi:hypothetical protein